MRSFLSVGGDPVVFSHGHGKWLTSVDGHRYIDFCGSWGPLILGYSHPEVLEAVYRQSRRALTFGAPSEEELLLAEKVRQWVPGLEMMRFVSSGTEATMSALRAARAATGRDMIVKFEGCYHGHADSLLVKAGSGLATLGERGAAGSTASAPSSAGVPRGAVQDTLTAPYNDKAAVEALFDAHPGRIAAIIIEPMAANMGLVLPEPGYLDFLREITRRNGAILIFDEVMTGFRVARGGACEAFGVEPDLWTFGKIIGGGLPAAAYGGKGDVMRHVAPLGKAYQAGTLSGNPLAMAAGLATLTVMERTGAFEKLESIGRALDEVVRSRLSTHLARGSLCYVRKASFFCFFFGTPRLPNNFTQVAACDMPLFGKVYHAWLEDGVYMGPSGYEVGFLSTCHEASDLEALAGTIARVLDASAH